MGATPLSDVQFLNFYVLSILRSAIARDPLSACVTFGLDRDELARLEPLLAPDRILAAVTSIGDESLVAHLRSDIVSLLSSPLPLMGALATVRSAPVSRPRPTHASTLHAAS